MVLDVDATSTLHCPTYFLIMCLLTVPSIANTPLQRPYVDPFVRSGMHLGIGMSQSSRARHRSTSHVLAARYWLAVIALAAVNSLPVSMQTSHPSCGVSIVNVMNHQ